LYSNSIVAFYLIGNGIKAGNEKTQIHLLEEIQSPLQIKKNTSVGDKCFKDFETVGKKIIS
jgi:hypothetical protein